MSEWQAPQEPRRPSLDPGIVAPGWFIDPLNASLQRYWDGTAWTKQMRPGKKRPRAPWPYGIPRPDVPADVRSHNRKLNIITGSVLGAIVLAIVIAVAVNSGGKSKPNPASSTAWSKPLTKTTCVEWLDTMTSDQRFGVAKDLIVRLDAKDKSDAFAREFESNISAACQPRLDTVADIAAALATIANGEFN